MCILPIPYCAPSLDPRTYDIMFHPIQYIT